MCGGWLIRKTYTGPVTGSPTSTSSDATLNQDQTAVVPIKKQSTIRVPAANGRHAPARRCYPGQPPAVQRLAESCTSVCWGWRRTRSACTPPGSDPVASDVFVGKPPPAPATAFWITPANPLATGRAVMIEPADNEQRWTGRPAGRDRWHPVDFDGPILSSPPAANVPGQ
jgi:CRISPR-associated protein Cas2